MSAKQIIFDQKVHDVTLSAVNKVVKAVATTLGPKGRNVVIESSFGPPKVTKDGATVAKSITLEDKAENMSAQLLIQAASGTAEAAGDGTTTSTVLGGSFTQKSIKYIASGMDPMGLSRGMDKAVERLAQELTALAKPCADSKSIEQVGTISANGDVKVGKLIAEAMEKVGKNGVITVEEGFGLEDQLKVVEGMQLDRGYLLPYFVNKPETSTAELEKPYILITDKKISHIHEIINIVEKVTAAGRALFIIAEDVEGEALRTLVANHLAGRIKVCAVKAPGFGDRRKEILQDIAVLTNAEVISEEIGLTFEQATLENLGSAKRVIVDSKSFTIIEGEGDQANIANRITEINHQITASDSSYEEEKLQERLAKLSGGVAVIKVGAPTEVAMKEKKARVEDALNATRAAVEEGIVPGGGVALLRAAKSLEDFKGENADEDAGISIVAQGIRAPLYQIVENAGGEAPVVANDILRGGQEKGDNYGYNAATGLYGDMIEMGIIDPKKVTRTALQKAASIAGMLITADCMVVELPKKEESASGGMGGMPGAGMDMM